MDNLRQLMAAYFHQDWYDEYGGSWEAAVDDFARRAPSRVAGTKAEIATLLRTTTSDAELVETLDALGNFYSAGEDRGSYRAWLESIEARLDREPPSASALRLAQETRHQA
jgi:CdiI immunity protein